MSANPNCFCFGLTIFSYQTFIEESFICFRQQCYKCVLDSLQRLLVIKTSPSQSPGRPTQPGPPPAPDPNAMAPLDADKLVNFKLPFFIRLELKNMSYICFYVIGDKYSSIGYLLYKVWPKWDFYILLNKLQRKILQLYNMLLWWTTWCFWSSLCDEDKTCFGRKCYPSSVVW